VRFVWDCEVEAVLGDDGVRGVRLRNRRTGERIELACAGVFPFIGAEPDTSYLPSAVERTREGLVMVDEQMRSSLPGLYAVGAVRAAYGGDLVNAAGDAALAVRALARDLSG
jgi:thioredoxin reductase (NADPH)